MKLNRITAVLILGAVVLGAAASSGPAAPLLVATSASADGPAASAGGAAVATTLNVRLPTDFSSLDPMVNAVDSIGFASVRPGYDFFLSARKDGKGFGPYLATSWTQKPKSITFKVRTDAVCTDGHKLTATDMLNSFKRFIFVPKKGGSPANTSAGSWGPGPYHLHANNKRATMTLSLDKPWRNLLGLFAGLPVICPSGLKALEADPNALALKAHGSGPYTLVSAEHSNQIVYKLRRNWKWGPPGASTSRMAENLIFKVIIDQTTAANLLATGGLDIATIAGPDVQRLRANSSLGYLKARNWFVAGLQFNMRPGRVFELGAGDALRKAIFRAVDPKAFNTAVYDSLGDLSPSNFRTDSECFDKSTVALRPAASMSAAKQILSAGGYQVVDGKLSKDGKRVPTLNILSSPSFFPNGGAYVSAVLRELGFDVELNDAGATYAPNAIGGNFDVFVVYSARPSPEPGSQMNGTQGSPSPVGGNIGGTGVGDPLWARYYNAALQNVGAGSCRYFALVQQSLIRNAYYVPIASPPYHVFYRKARIVGTLPVWAPEAFGYPWFQVQAKR